MTEVSISVHEFNVAKRYIEDVGREPTQENIDDFFNQVNSDPMFRINFNELVAIEEWSHATALRSHFASMTDEEREKWHRDYDIMSRIVLSIFGVIGLAVGSLLLISFVNRALNSFGWGVLI